MPQTIDIKSGTFTRSARGSKSSIKERTTPRTNSAHVHIGPELRRVILRSISQPIHHQNKKTVSRAS